MKNLLYKELKLAMHPICYIFPVLFGIMIMIPNYPTFVASIYVLVCYPILFLGANKGQTTNDLFYTCNLPVRKADVVKARLLTLSLLQLMNIFSMAVFMPVQLNLNFTYMGLGAESFLALYAFMILGYALHDLFYVTWFYKTGKSIIAPSLLGLLLYCIYAIVFIMALPMRFSGVRTMLSVTEGGKVGLIIQISMFILSLAIYFGLRFLTYKISAKRLENLDL